MRVTRLLHPTDFSACAYRALDVAIYLAVSHRVPLHVFHAHLLHADDPARERFDLAEYVDDARSRARAWLEHDPAGTFDIETHETRGIGIFDALMAEVGRIGADLVVMGTHGRTGVGKLLMGSQTDKLLRHAPCHVMTVRADAKVPEPGRGFARLLTPVDFSDPSRRALEVACSIARETGGAITLAHVISTVVTAHYAALVGSPFELDPRTLGAAEQKLREWAGDDAVDIVLAEGLASIEIVRLASELDADLVVMGTRGLTGLEHVLVGSVTERVCRSSAAPVLVVK